jgi:hypothetical protein
MVFVASDYTVVNLTVSIIVENYTFRVVTFAPCVFLLLLSDKLVGVNLSSFVALHTRKHHFGFDPSFLNRPLSFLFAIAYITYHTPYEFKGRVRMRNKRRTYTPQYGPSSVLDPTPQQSLNSIS